MGTRQFVAGLAATGVLVELVGDGELSLIAKVVKVQDGVKIASDCNLSTGRVTVIAQWSVCEAKRGCPR